MIVVEKREREAYINIYTARRDNFEAVIKLVCHISFHYWAILACKRSKRPPFSSGFHFFYDSGFHRARQRKIKYYFSIHELIVRNLGNIQLQFRRGVQYKALLDPVNPSIYCFTPKWGTRVEKQINLI